jgi:uncharacterized membrane protein
MSDPQLTTDADVSGDLTEGQDVVLTAKLSDRAAEYEIKWRLPGATDDSDLRDNPLPTKAPPVGKPETYTAIATPKTPGGNPISATEELKSTQKADEPNGETGGENPSTEIPMVFDGKFAALVAIPVVLVAVAFFAPLGYFFATRSYGGDAIDQVIVLISLSLLTIGAFVMLFGVYAGLLEVRGRMRTAKQLKEAQDRGLLDSAEGVAKIIDAIGKLRGAAMILVIACVPLLAATWLAQTAVDNKTAPTSTATATASPVSDGSGTGDGSGDTNSGNSGSGDTGGSDNGSDAGSTGGGDESPSPTPRNS